MPQSLAQIFIHLIFSTKYREPDLADPELRTATHDYLATICNRLNSPVLAVGGVADHVHVACRLSRTLRISDLVGKLKQESSLWIKNQSEKSSCFYWQAGYGAFSVSPGHLEPLQQYIANQEEHHKAENFQSEYLRLLTKYRVDYHKEFIWD